MSPLSKQTEDKTLNEASPFILWESDLLTLDPPPNTVLMSTRHKMNETHNNNRNSVNYSKHPKKLHGYGQFSNDNNIEIYTAKQKATDTMKA